ncbi:CRISPR system precrRNA processing endoribonuclease RAMP protein Cas6 [Geobacter sp. AOG1]|uniref:CRISPR system precrRNA processing endoribonuclease RAMP protein Cas6 n=1 Tax=Geobacter sp. AOG1 TaxID=1566346 RepID=UPI001CC5A975|nr:CRISPR system precrRNA processing endoribonuclease RAMP protein Cas6 [Geobacter sp. AOG1]GFE59158.1 hypothetical protein AOG1_30380 [Geobacter sp. AOG1]
MEFNLVRLVITLRLDSDIADPLALFGLNSCFAEAFRRTSKCEGTHDTECPYSRSFSQSLSTDPAAVRRHQKPPLPFAFSLPLLPSPPNRGGQVEISLTLVGAAIQDVSFYLDALACAFSRFGPAGRYTAVPLRADTVDYYGARTLFWELGKRVCDENLILLSAEGIQQIGTLAADEVKLRIVTPLRLLSGGKPVRELTFSSLVRCLFRRITSLAYYYGGHETGLDFRWLAERSLHVSCTDGDFYWQGDAGKHGGIVGSGTFRGDLSEFHPFLLLGEYLQCGKGAAYGYGAFRLEKSSGDLS